MPTPFDKDLGYLDRFLDKLRDHAEALPEDAGQALQTLLAEEGERWDRIRVLLGDGAAEEGTEAGQATGAAEGAEGTEPRTIEAPAPQPAQATPPPSAPRLTVGEGDRPAPRPGWTVGDPRRHG